MESNRKFVLKLKIIFPIFVMRSVVEGEYSAKSVTTNSFSSFVSAFKLIPGVSPFGFFLLVFRVLFNLLNVNKRNY